MQCDANAMQMHENGETWTRFNTYALMRIMQQAFYRTPSIYLM